MSKYLKTHLLVAREYAQESHAKLLKVGALVIKNDRIISTGWNGTPPGFDNKCEYSISFGINNEQLKTKDEVIHAEMNALGYCAKNGIATDSCIMVVTHTPCFRCSKLIVAAGIKALYFGEQYKQDKSLKFLKDAGLKVERIEY